MYDGPGGKVPPRMGRQPPISLQTKQPLKRITKEDTDKKKKGATDAQLEALRIPLLHLLALGSDTTNHFAVKTRAPIELCLRILHKLGNRTRAGNHWELVDDYFRELDVWKFPYANDKDRETAIKNAQAAYNRLRLSAEATEWDRLVKPEERGKVKIGPTVPTLPKPRAVPALKVVKQDDKPFPAGEPSPTFSEHSAASDSRGRSGSQQPLAAAAKPGKKDTISRIIANKGKAPKERAPPKEKAAPGAKRGRPPKPKAEAAAKVIKRPTKWKHPEGGLSRPQPAYKSKEFVDSEDEAEDTPLKDAPRTAVKSPPTAAPAPQSLAAKLAGRSPAKRPDLKAEREKARATVSPVKKGGVLTGKISKIGSPAAAMPRKSGVGAKTVPLRAPEPVAEKSSPQKERPVAVAGKRPAAAAAKSRAKALPKETEQPPRPRTPAKTITPPVRRSPAQSSPLAENVSTATSTPGTMTTNETIETPNRSPEPIKRGSVKRKGNWRDEEASAPKRREVDPDILGKAQKFKSLYAVYATLYDEAKNGNQGGEGVTVRLLEMHEELREWKRELNRWAEGATAA